mmetsp:Transcript_28154/g.57672  ORF Transcript_28154/g.57672 Transcript_28154/m.57672 type:complete len:211 (-) Transcript_28154:915-1547(-)
MSTMPLRICPRFTFLSASVTDCPARAPVTGRDLFMMLLSCTGTKAPWESGPRTKFVLSDTLPRINVPPTTAPTPVTVNVSSMWNCAGSLLFWQSSSFWAGTRLSQRWRSGRFSPVVLLTLKIGAIRAPFPIAFAAETTSASFCTRRGMRRMPGDLMMRISSLRVFCSTCWGHMSIFVTTKKVAHLRASATPRCSRVIRCTPMFAPTTTMV